MLFYSTAFARLLHNLPDVRRLGYIAPKSTTKRVNFIKARIFCQHGNHSYGIDYIVAVYIVSLGFSIS